MSDEKIINYPLEIPFKDFMPGQVIQSGQFNDDMAEIEEKVNEVVEKHNILTSETDNHVSNKENPHEVTAHQVGTYSEEEINAYLEDIRNGGLYDKSIENRVLDDGCVEARNIKNASITSIKVDSNFGSQINISKNMDITDRYTKKEVDDLLTQKVGEGTYSKEELNQMFEDVQAGQIVDGTIDVSKLKDNVGKNLDISANPSITDRYTKAEVNVLIQENGLPRDWGGLEEIVQKQHYGELPIADVMTADEFIAPLTPVLDIDVKEVVEARNGFNNLSDRLEHIEGQIGNNTGSDCNVDLSDYVTNVELESKNYATKNYVDNVFSNVNNGNNNGGSTLNGKVYNVKNYGAKGDGFTNDLVAIQNAISALEDDSTLYFPSGTYILGNGDSTQILLWLELLNNIKIVGDSKEVSIIKAHPNTPVTNKMGLINFERCNNVLVENLQFDGSVRERYVRHGEFDWGDIATEVDDCSNICINSGENIVIRNVYSHHPIIDCICVARYAGGNTPNGKNLIIENCILDYGYRQGVSIVGFDNVTIRDTKITNTANATNPNKPSEKIGTLPMAGIDSETWAYNEYVVIENCYFESNRGGHINMNDGASEHVIDKCVFIGDDVTVWGIISQTPSAGARTLNNVITNCTFRNCIFDTQGGVFTVTHNNFIYDNPSITRFYNQINANNHATIFSGSTIFSNNRMIVRLDSYEKAGINLSSLDIRLVIAESAGAIVSNNVFCNMISPTFFQAYNSSGTMILGNVFTATRDLTSYSINANVCGDNTAIVANNRVSSNYPSRVITALGK